MVEEQAEEQKEEIGSGPQQKSHFWKGFLAAILAVAFVFWGISRVSGQLGVRGSGVVVSEEREVSGFEKVELSGHGNLFIDQTGEESLRIEAEDNLINRIETRVEGKSLKIWIKDRLFFGSFLPTRDINYYLTVDKLELIDIIGSADVTTENLAADSLEIRISGSGEGDLVLDVNNLNVNISGSGKFTLAGKSTDQVINIMGSGNYDAKNLSSSKAKIDVSGSGKGIINASEELDVKISGSGTIQYIGSPKISQKISGSGEVSEYKGGD